VSHASYRRGREKIWRISICVGKLSCGVNK
jgi:hypothetical protein